VFGVWCLVFGVWCSAKAVPEIEFHGNSPCETHFELMKRMKHMNRMKQNETILLG
jgi:hypothetical protein